MAMHLHGRPPIVTLTQCKNCASVLATAQSLKALPDTTYVHDCNRCLGKSEFEVAEMRRTNERR